MYNFLDPKLLAKVSSSCPSMEDYEADNLINSNSAIRSRGFMAYTITKPPISLDFNLLCPANIFYIYLNTTIGKQKCTGIELFMKSSKSPFISIGKAFYSSDSIVFCNSRKYSKDNPPPINCKNLFFFKSNTFRSFLHAETVRIVIISTDKSVPCVSSIKICGVPSRNCSVTTLNTISKIMGNSSEQTQNHEHRNEEMPNIKESSEIPQDFIDDLTCEIMAIPMTLPSGKTVDHHTLEKHIENEKSFGRKGCDPFTGLPFTNTRKAVINTALKSRIDMFLLQNSSNPLTFGTKRTLGRDLACETSKRIKSEELSEVKCLNCDIKDYLYILSTCKHVFCRGCLVDLKQICKLCKTEFSNSIVSRFHSSELKH